MAFCLSLSFSMGFSGLAPTLAPALAPARGADSTVRMLGGQDYSPEETEEILQNQAASFVVGARAVPLPWTSDEIQDTEGLKKLALKLNPVVGY